MRYVSLEFWNAFYWLLWTLTNGISIVRLNLELAEKFDAGNYDNRTFFSLYVSFKSKIEFYAKIRWIFSFYHSCPYRKWFSQIELRSLNDNVPYNSGHLVVWTRTFLIKTSEKFSSVSEKMSFNFWRFQSYTKLRSFSTITDSYMFHNVWIFFGVIKLLPQCAILFFATCFTYGYKSWFIYHYFICEKHNPTTQTANIGHALLSGL